MLILLGHFSMISTSPHLKMRALIINLTLTHPHESGMTLLLLLLTPNKILKKTENRVLLSNYDALWHCHFGHTISMKKINILQLL